MIKVSPFDQNFHFLTSFNCWPNFQLLNPNFIFWPKFQFWPTFKLWPKFHFLTWLHFCRKFCYILYILIVHFFVTFGYFHLCFQLPFYPRNNKMRSSATVKNKASNKSAPRYFGCILYRITPRTNSPPGGSIWVINCDMHHGQCSLAHLVATGDKTYSKYKYERGWKYSW